MPHGLQLARKPLRAWTCFHANQRSVSAFEELEKRLSTELRSLDWCAGVIEADHVEKVLSDIDAEYCACLWFVAFHDEDLLLAYLHCARWRQGGPSH